MLLLHDKGYFIKHVHIQFLEYVVRGNITEKGNFVFVAFVQGLLRTADKDVRLESHSLKVFDAGLGGFCLEFAGSF